MADCQHLNIYKSMFDFTVYFSNLFRNYQKEFRYTLGERLMIAALDFMALMFRANEARTPEARIKYLESMQDKLNGIMVMLRISCALHCMAKEKYAHCCIYLNDVKKQLSAWLNYTLNNTATENKETIKQ